MQNNNDPLTLFPTKPHPQTIKLSKTALTQHNKITQLTEQNELLLIKLKKCKEAVANHDTHKRNKQLEIRAKEEQLGRLREENGRLEGEEAEVKEMVRRNYGEIGEKKSRIQQYNKTNSRIQHQILQLSTTIAQQTQQQQCLLQKIHKKQQIYEQSEQDMHTLQEENKKIEAEISVVERQIRKIEEVLRMYKDGK